MRHGRYSSRPKSTSTSGQRPQLHQSMPIALAATASGASSLPLASQRIRSMLARAMAAPKPTLDELATWVADARRRTFALVDDLSDEQLMGPRLAIVNPLRWEIGHVAWFQEFWVLRHARGQPP